ncbi:recQ-mediated genome instability protein 1-like [Panulirus ornatus]|uniref:recQ-mediated genome instability protein 1-like n=1 Tax=Panulirus ornatus TaxID=150431 RepID=UPI003A84175F
MIAAQNNVKAYLKARHIEVPDEWITACIEWIQSENPGENINNNKALPKIAYQQWLYCDLTELATSCLPFGLSEKRSDTISGHFAVQVNQVRDVGRPAYAQLQKVQGVDSANAAVSAEHSHQSSWEPKPLRMLLMQMTDGTSVVQGMEYTLIPSISINLKPGTKVMLSGTIRTRRGILLLSQEHITILGGEIESLLISNAMENVLARHLGSDETEQPRQYEETNATQATPSQISQYYPSQINSASNRSQASHPPGRGGTQPLSGVRNLPGISGPSANNFDDMGNDDFLDSDFEAALNQIESQASSCAKSNSSLVPCNRSSNVVSRTNNACPEISRNGVGNSCSNELDRKNLRLNALQSNAILVEEMDGGMNTDNDFFSDDFDDDILLSAEGQVDESYSSLQASTSAKITSQLTSKDPDVSSKSLKLSSGPSSLPPNNESCQLLLKENASCIKTPTPVCSIIEPEVNSISQSTTQNNTNRPLAGQSWIKDSLSKSSSQALRGKRLKKSTLVQHDICDADNFKKDFLPKSSCPATPNSFMEETQRIMKTSPLDSKFRLTSPRISSFKEIATPVSQEMNMKYTSEKTRDVEKRAKQMPPFTYLFFLPEKPSVPQEFIVKGFIMTLVSRLEQSGGLWKLAVIINDGTASREVDIDDLVLQELIGMSAEQMNQRKAEARSNPILKSQLAKNVGGCQQKLISLCSLLHLQVSPGLTNPRLTSISSVTSTTAEQLINRLFADA